MVLSVLVCDIWINALLYASELVGPIIHKGKSNKVTPKQAYVALRGPGG
jgi:hypothetical protein